MNRKSVFFETLPLSNRNNSNVIQKCNVNGKPCTILMAKHENAVSYNQNLLHIAREKIPSTVVLILVE